jgi:molecular chaperone GrpE
MSHTENNKEEDSDTRSADEETENNRDSRNKDTLGEESRNADIEEEKIETDIENLQRQLGKTEALVETYKDQILRLAAEFENFKKRVEVDRADFVKFSNEKIIKDLIPVLDDFERALTKSNQDSDPASFRKGIELIYQKLYKLLEDKGLKPIESIGREFDVTYHDVLMQVPKEGVKPYTIIDEVERGYTLHGKVIKHAKVIVASPAHEKPEPEKVE